MGGGDGGRAWAVVLLGATGAGKSTLGNVLLEKMVFPEGHTAASCTKSPQLESELISTLDNVPLVVIDTPGFGDSEGRDKANMLQVTELLANIQFINAFLLVVNGESLRFDRQIFAMLEMYISLFGTFFFNSLVVVVTHWEMTQRSQSMRTRKGITQESFQAAWLHELQAVVDISACDTVIPFVFFDAEPFRNHTEEGEIELALLAKMKIFEYVSQYPLFACLPRDASPAERRILQNAAIELELTCCRKCQRYYHTANPTTLSTGSLAGATVSSGTQGAIASARIARVVVATRDVWSSDGVVKAMTRGWNANTGVHLAGKAASRIGPLISVGVGMYRVVKADTTTEKVQAAVGTGAGILGGYAGASAGAVIGTAILPGIGTIIGGVVGGLASSFGLQMGAEKCVAKISEALEEDLCPCCVV